MLLAGSCSLYLKDWIQKSVNSTKLLTVHSGCLGHLYITWSLFGLAARQNILANLKASAKCHRSKLHLFLIAPY